MILTLCSLDQKAPVSEKCGCGNSPNPPFQLNPSSSTICKMLVVSASERSFVETRMNHIFAVHCETLFNPFVLLVTFQEYDASHTRTTILPFTRIPPAKIAAAFQMSPGSSCSHLSYSSEAQSFLDQQARSGLFTPSSHRIRSPTLYSKPLRALPVS